MKSSIFACFAAALILLASAPAFAGSCPMRMDKIDAALSSAKLSQADMGKVTSLRAKGEAMHKAGKHAESVAALKEAQKILGIE